MCVMSEDKGAFRWVLHLTPESLLRCGMRLLRGSHRPRPRWHRWEAPRVSVKRAIGKEFGIAIAKAAVGFALGNKAFNRAA